MSSQTTLWQFQGFRGIFNLCFLMIFLTLIRKINFIYPKNYFAVYLRALFLTITMIFFFSGAPYLTISQMAAGLYTYPLFVVMLAGPILNEKISLPKLTSLILGFTGAGLILAPWKNDFTFFQFLPIFSGFFYACNILTIRKLCKDETPYAMAAAVAITFITFCFIMLLITQIVPFSYSTRELNPYLLDEWIPLTSGLLSVILLVSMFNVSGNLLITKAYQSSESSWLAPIDYTYFIFAVFWSKMFFDQIPNELGFLGIFCICSAGILIGLQRKN